MARRSTCALLLASLLSACPGGGDPGVDASSPTPGLDAAARDAATPPDAAVAGPPDAAYQCRAPDAGFAGGLEALCADLVAGESALALRNATACGEPLRAEDMTRLATVLVEGCEPGTRRESDLRRVAASLAAGRVRLDAAKQAACRDLGRGHDAGTPFDDAGALGEPCQGVLVGQVAPGGACQYDEECSPGLWCSLAAAGSCTGACVAGAVEGTPCRALTDHCEQGTWCLPDLGDAGTSRCRRVPGLGEPCSDYCAAGSCVGGSCVEVPPAKEGEPCQGGGGCEDGLGCAGAGDAGPGTCRPLALEGAPCGEAEPACASCLSCSASTGRCVRREAVGDPCSPDAGASWASHTYCGAGGVRALKPRTGEACTRASGCLYSDDFCSFATAADPAGVCAREPGPCEPCGGRPDLSPSCRQGHCVVERGETAGVCAPLSGQGEPCDLAPCRSGLTCEAGRCEAAPAAAGAECTRTGACGPGLRCAAAAVDGGARLCEARRTAGEACSSDSECLSGSCASGTCTAGSCPENQLAKGCWMGSAFEYFGYLVFFAAALTRRRRRG